MIPLICAIWAPILIALTIIAPALHTQLCNSTFLFHVLLRSLHTTHALDPGSTSFLPMCEQFRMGQTCLTSACQRPTHSRVPVHTPASANTASYLLPSHNWLDLLLAFSIFLEVTVSCLLTCQAQFQFVLSGLRSTWGSCSLEAYAQNGPKENKKTL